MALLLFRTGGNTFIEGGGSARVTTETWERWTGFKPRMMNAALAGLKDKGFAVEGRGDKARIMFEPDRWREYVKQQAALNVEPRTAGRKKTEAVKSKPGMMVHPDCKEHGCQNLCGQGEKPAPCLVDPPKPISPAKPVPPSKLPPPTERRPAAATRELVSAPRNNRDVAAWHQTLETVSGIFPTAGSEFVLRLVGRARAVAPTVNDQRLAAAVVACWLAKKHTQKSEGLFLETVPKYLENCRGNHISAHAPCSQCLGSGTSVDECGSASMDDWKLIPCPKCRGSALEASA